MLINSQLDLHNALKVLILTLKWKVCIYKLSRAHADNQLTD